MQSQYNDMHDELMSSLSVFGFLGGKEIKEAGVGNLGLHDRRSQRITLDAREVT